jgi:AcrR family transcriptional regulator
MLLRVSVRRRISKEEREATMLAEAGVVFAARGYTAASMDEIAERVGVSKPMVYSHFGSKEQLYFAYIEDAGRDLLAGIVDAERAARDLSPEERLRAGTRAFFAFVDDHRDGFAVLYSEMAASGGPFRREVNATRRQIVELVALLFDRVARRNGISSESFGGTEPLAVAYVGAGESLANWWLEHAEDAGVDDVTDRLLTVAWKGVEGVLSGQATPGVTGQ